MSFDLCYCGFEFQNVSLSMEIVRPLLFPNQQLSSLKLDCGRLGNSAIDILVRPSLREISLHNCRDFSGDLISEIGRKCKDLRYVFIEVFDAYESFHFCV